MSAETQREMSEGQLNELLKPYLEIAPALKVAGSSHEEEATRRQLLSSLLRALEGLQSTERDALIEALNRLGSHPALTGALTGDLEALEATAEALVSAHLSAHPWSGLSERALITLWYQWIETLSEGVNAHRESLWVSAPTVSVQRWIELGWDALLDQALKARLPTTHTPDELSETPGEHSGEARPRLIGVRIYGAGKSAHLAYARRWFLSQGVSGQGVSTSWLSSLDESPAKADLEALLIDDLHIAERGKRWRLARALVEWRARSAEGRALVVVWGDDGGADGLGALLAAEVDALLEFDLDAAWSELDALPPLSQAPEALWLTERHPNLTLCDVLRIRDLLDAPSAQASRDQVGEITGYAALIGPLASLRALARATDLSEEAIRHILNDSGWIELEEHSQGGARFAPPSPEAWRVALLEGGARAHRCAAGLMTAIEEVYHGAPPREERAALQRLSLLRGQGAYRAPLKTPLDLDAATEALQGLTPALTHDPPSPLALSTLCGLALDWAQLGPLTGAWDSAIRALELGVASARKLRDPRRAALILFTLGRLALDDARGALAEEALGVATELLASTGDAQESRRAAQLLAEALLLRGDVAGGLAQLAMLEERGRSEGANLDAWRARFRSGQIYARTHQPERALTLWSALTPPRSLGEDLSTSRATIALALECAGSLLELGRDGEAWDWLNQLSTRSALGEALFAVAQWRLSGAPPMRALITQAERARAARDIGEWAGIQRWIALISLELDASYEPPDGEPSQREALSVACRGLEAMVQVTAGARDRLQLIMSYDLLSRVYLALEQREAHEAAAAMSRAWAESLTLPEGIEMRSGGARLEPLAAPPEPVIIDATAEVGALIAKWAEVSLSAAQRSALEH